MMTTADMRERLLQTRSPAATLTPDKIPSEAGIYVWYTKSGEVVYVGKATGKGGLRRRIGRQHLSATYLETRPEKFRTEDDFQRGCGFLKNGKVCVDKSVFRRSIGRSQKLAPGAPTVQYIRDNLDVAWLTEDLIGDAPQAERDLIRELAPKLNVSGAAKRSPPKSGPA
jgi:hypothetical protein